MNVANIISIIGNNTSVTPILVKDGIESSSKVYLADKQGRKVSKEQGFYEARESAIEEFGTTAIWFAAPLVIGKAFNAIAKKTMGLSSDKILKADTELLDGKHFQTLEKNAAQFGDSFIKADTKKISSDKLSKLVKGRGLFGVAATIGMLAGLTLFKQKVTKQSIEKHGAPKGITFQGMMRDKIETHPTFAAFTHKKEEQTSSEPSFKGIRQLVEQASIDAGVGGIRIGTARDKDEMKEYMFNTVAFIALNYLTAPVVEKAMNSITKSSNLPIDLDAKVIADKDFVKDVESATKDASTKQKMLEFINLDKNAKPVENEEKVINFIDEELKKAKFDSKGNFESFNNHTLEVARKSGIIQIDKNKRAVNKFIDTKKVEAINSHLKEIIEASAKKGDNTAFFKNLKATKYGTVLANIAICSTLVGVVLPKLRYMFREKGIGTVASPGVKAYDHHLHQAQQSKKA